MSGIPASKRTLLFAIAVLAIALLACNLSTLVSQPTPTPQPTATSQPTPTPQPTATTQLSNIITSAVMAKDASGDAFDPVGITDSFPANQSIFHAVVTIANAPDNTDFKVNWLAAPSTQIGTFDLKSGGSRNLDFSFKPNAGTLPAGSYKAEIYVNGTLNRTLSFSVSGASQVQPTEPSQSVKPQPSGYIGDVVMAEDSKGANFDPVNPTVTFKPSATFHAVVTLQNAPANTKFTAAWYVVDVGSAAPPNSKIDSTDITTDGSRNIDFTLKPASTWPVGSYRVEISVNGVLDRVVNFSISASSSGQPTAAPPTQARPTVPPPPPTTAPTPAGLTCGNGVLDAGMVGVYVTNNFDGELLFAIASHSYKIPGHSTLLVQVPGGKPFSYSATITGVGTLTDGPYTFDPGSCVPFTPHN